MSKKIKDVFCGIIVAIVLFGSMGATLVDFFIKYGKGASVIYFFIYIWALDYIFKENEEKVSMLKRENKRLKENLDSLEQTNKYLETKIRELSH